MLKSSHDSLENRGKVAKSLTWRISIWVVLFLLIIVSKEIGWLDPSESMNPKKFHEEMNQRQ